MPTWWNPRMAVTPRTRVLHLRHLRRHIMGEQGPVVVVAVVRLPLSRGSMRTGKRDRSCVSVCCILVLASDDTLLQSRCRTVSLVVFSSARKGKESVRSIVKLCMNSSCVEVSGCQGARLLPAVLTLFCVLP